MMVFVVVVVVVVAVVDLVVVVVVVVGKDCGIVGVDWRRFIAERRNGRPSLVFPKFLLDPNGIRGAKFFRVAKGS